MVASWHPLLSSAVTSVVIGVSGLIILCKATQRPRKVHVMNVFNQQAFALLFMAFFVRSLFWLVWINPGTPLSENGNDNDGDTPANNIGMSISIRAFLITYPSMNILIIAFLIQYPWIYDYIIMTHGREIYLDLRQKWKTFVVATNIFTLLMYLVYAFAFPIGDDSEKGKLFELYKTLMVFEIISGVLVICQIASSVRRIEMQHRELGRAVKRQGFTFLFSNICAAIGYYLMGRGVIIFGNEYFIFSLLIQLTFYFLTETVPLLSFI